MRLPKPITIVGHQNGPRLYVMGLRVHHGVSGALVASVGAVRLDPRLTLAGLGMMVHDAHDYRVWFHIEKCPERTKK